MRRISKRFGAVQALQDVSIDCRAGEIHAVVGENGSGKSTLLGIASGFLAPDEGAVEIAGRRLRAGSAARAHRLGLAMAYQSYSHVIGLTVAENLFLATPRRARPPLRRVESWAAERLAQYELGVRPDAPIGAVPLADRQLLEVVKALLSEPRVLLLDEPTTALGPGEVERLHGLVLERASKQVAIVYVSHRLPEVLGIAARVTVLRDGSSQGTFAAATVSEQDLVTLMIGRPRQLAFPDRRADEDAEDALLTVSDLSGDRFGPVDLALRRGEILGVAGAAGNGQAELVRALAGVERSSGTIRYRASTLGLRSPAGALREGVVFLSGERLRESLFPILGVRSNSTIQVLKRLSRLGWVRRGREKGVVLDIARRLKVRTPSIDQPVKLLSGGNQQKVVVSRPFLRQDTRVILADEPTQGVDVGSRFDLYDALRTEAGRGIGIIVKSSDPIELAGLCDRVVVMSRGRIVDEIPAAELSERRIVEAIVGSRATARRAGAGDVA